MKLKVSVFIIIISTAAIIGVMNLALSRSNDRESPKTTDGKEQLDAPTKRAPQKLPKNVTGQRVQTHDGDDDDDDIIAEFAPVDARENSAQAVTSNDLSSEDIKKINSIVSLSESDLARELNSLKDQIEKEDLFAKLEDGLLTDQNSIEAKEKLERFALLGLEGTRRKYMDMEPELKDPIYAYKDSIKEIRELLNDDFEDDDDEDDDEDF